MKFYYPSTHYNGSYRIEVFPLLKAFIKKDIFNDEQRREIYGVSSADFEFVDKLEEAQIVILPMSWNYYINTKQLEVACDLIDKANLQNTIVWSYNSGDFGVKLPKFKNVIVFRLGGYVRNRQLGHFGFPAIINDFIRKHQIQDVFLNNTYSVQPIVGFCGQANASRYNAFKEKAKQSIRNLLSFFGLSPLERQRVLSTSYLRANLLETLEKCNAIDSRFIKRKKYRAGVIKRKETHKTTQEFYENILESQYVLCVRGAGNFSVRFYETLMMGRIPLYVHTDGYLPLCDEIDWKEHVVWIDYDQRYKISEILLRFHKQMDQEKLINMFKRNRQLWEDKLTLSGFFKTIKYKLLEE